MFLSSEQDGNVRVSYLKAVLNDYIKFLNPNFFFKSNFSTSWVVSIETFQNDFKNSTCLYPFEIDLTKK